MKLFGKGKPGVAATSAAPTLQQIDRGQLLGLLDQIVSGGQTAILTLQDQGGTWVYAFQNGGLVHASGGRVRGARQAFDLLWEFQDGAFVLTPGSDPGLPSNLYIDKGRLHELVGRSQAAYQAAPPAYYQPQQPGAPYPPQPWPPAGQQPAWGPAQAMPQPPAGAPAAWGPPPGAPAPGYPAPYPPQSPQPQYQPQPAQPGPPPPQYLQAPPGAPQALPPNVVPFPGGQPPRPAPSFSVPPMPIPRKPDGRQPAPAAPAAPGAPVPPSVPGVTPQDDLRVLRASLVAQTQAERAASATWKVRGNDGAKAAAPARVKAPKPVQAKKPSKLKAKLEERTIKFLLWACERHYSPDDHWTLKDAFEVATMELKDQFLGAFSQSLKASGRGGAAADDDDVDQVEAGRRSRQRRRR